MGIQIKYYNEALRHGGCGEAVNTADCGSVMRAFESRQPPQSGNDGNMETPGPIPNPEVKHILGDDSFRAKIANCQAVLRGIQSDSSFFILSTIPYADNLL